ncbi:hydratase [Flexilinea flocculi]|uniref:Aconitase A n=1 Tax=Flexilinea flocculi TaxID=1678840 RepID=A0A0S7BXZ2_9CHLR|nr:hydratase [Flexilinea flocculi]GAP41199.1 aconitase A [Flexilinea flocculi]
MIECIDKGFYYSEGTQIIDAQSISEAEISALKRRNGLPENKNLRENTMTYQIMMAHNLSAVPGKMRIKFDALISHDITYVGIIQSARVGGLTKFPVPYALTNCHNSLCAVGGTINEDDHVYGLSAARKFGGIYVPANQAVIHQYAREMMTGCGKMLLGSDSHTRYGAMGTMGIGEGGPELVKQLLSNTYDIDNPPVVMVYLENEPKNGVGPHDVALALVKAVFGNGFVKNKVLEFVGPGIKKLPMDFRIGIDVMTTETACLSSIWEIDEEVEAYYETHARPEAYQPLHPGSLAFYDSMIRIDLSEIEPMIALPFHPSNAYSIHELLENPGDILRSVEIESAKNFGDNLQLKLTNKVQGNHILTDQGIIAGCSGGMFDNICAAADILDHSSSSERFDGIGNSYFSLSVYPSSMPVSAALMENGVLLRLQKAGVVTKMAFCGPCFGAGDVPANHALSIRHTTRNFPNREGSKPDQGQITGVALMDARSIAATAANGGFLTAATDLEIPLQKMKYHFDKGIYQKRVYFGFDKPIATESLRMGPNITDWPTIYPLAENLLLVLTAVIKDAVTTTDELIPSGETSSYRSNPQKLAEFALSRRVPSYVRDSKRVQQLELNRLAGNPPEEILAVLRLVTENPDQAISKTAIGSVIFANKPGDGSAREQAASSQKVLGGYANIAREYATKRYRSNCINWGILPFTIGSEVEFDYKSGDMIYVPNIREAIQNGVEKIPAKIITQTDIQEIILYCSGLTVDERQIILDGCLMNFYASKKDLASEK